MSCYEIVELLGQKNHGHEYWELAVFSEDHEVFIYLFIYLFIYFVLLRTVFSHLRRTYHIPILTKVYAISSVVIIRAH